jgi:uncharacterized protein (TIGR04255 family)
VKFKKPPIVEAWIEFKVGLTDESVGWDESTAKELINKHFADFKQQEFFGLTEVKIDPKTANVLETRRSFERVRAFTEDRDQCVQGGRNLLVYNQIRQGEKEWPGYERLRDSAFDALQKYLDFRTLNTLVGVSLHYLDIVAIPKGKDGKIKLEDYFTVYPHLPDGAFGAISGFRVAMQLPQACKGGNMTLSIQSLPAFGPSEDKGRFSIDWHVTSDGKTHDVDSARQWLEQAHKDLRGVFVAGFTEQGFAIFEPEGR